MNGVDILALQETWHHDSDDIALCSSAPDGYSIIDAARLADHPGGGVAIIFRTACNGRKLTLPFHPTSFESVSAEFNSAGHHLIVVSIYRPGSAALSCQFFDDITCLLDHFAAYSCPVILVGDFNINMELHHDPSAARLTSIMERFDFRQLVNCSTHLKTGTLDLIITQSNSMVSLVDVCDNTFTDHYTVYGALSWPKSQLLASDNNLCKFVRSWKLFDVSAFRSSLSSSIFCVDPEEFAAQCSTDELYATYSSTLIELLDRHGPALDQHHS